MRLLALDIGMKRTGCAFYDPATGIPLPLDTLEHTSVEEFAGAVSALAAARKIDQLIIGLPLLPSGQEGRQAQIVKEYVSALPSPKLPITYVDERYTTPDAQNADGDAMAALSILTSYCDKNDI